MMLKILEEKFKKSGLNPEDSMEILEMDSLNYIELASYLEDEGVNIELEEIFKCQKIEDLLKLGN